jgi:hypothetical protein
MGTSNLRTDVRSPFPYKLCLNGSNGMIFIPNFTKYRSAGWKLPSRQSIHDHIAAFMFRNARSKSFLGYRVLEDITRKKRWASNGCGWCSCPFSCTGSHRMLSREPPYTTLVTGGEEGGRCGRRPQTSCASHLYFHVSKLPLLLMSPSCLTRTLSCETVNDEEAI